MRFLILSTDYSDFLKWLYTNQMGLADKSYQEQVHARSASLFNLADFYSSNLRELGHEAWDIEFNNRFMQQAWAREHGLQGNDRSWEFRLRRGFIPWFGKIRNAWVYNILAAQIKYYKPDILFNHSLDLSRKFLREMKPHVRLLIGSHASPLPKDRDFSVYDLILSSVDNIVNYFRKEGVKSELLRFGFEPRVLEVLGKPERSIPVSFVGNLFHAHGSRRQWLEEVCNRTPVQIWAPSTPDFPDDSSIIRSHQGTAWGIEMYKILRGSRITLNNHVDIAEGYAGNIRLFEATGVGTLLVTDSKTNLHEMFVPGREVIAYRTAAECVELIQYYLESDKEREAIALAGQQRTLRDHTYHKRMQELVSIVQKQTGM